MGFGLVGVTISEASAQAQSGMPLPMAKEIVARYDKALGEEEAFGRHSASTMPGTMEIPGASLAFI